MSWLLCIVLQWTCGCMYLFQCKFYLDICPRVGLLDHVVVLYWVFWGIFMLFSIVVVPIYICGVKFWHQVMKKIYFYIWVFFPSSLPPFLLSFLLPFLSLSLSLSLSFFCLFRATPMAYGSSQARGWIGATAASLCHSNTGSEPCLWPTPQL